MDNGILLDGFPSIEEIRAANGWPGEGRFAKGPVAIVECVQEIPCNPCQGACPTGAIRVGEPITNTPRVNYDSCTGCGLCIAACSGLAIFVVDKTYSETEGTVSFPFEYLPLPEKGSRVAALSRGGGYVCEGTVVRVVNGKRNDHTPVVTVAVPKEHTDTVRTIRRLNLSGEAPDFSQADENTALDDNVIVCRCEEVTAGDIRRAIREFGGTSVTEVKRRARCGMGLCQGKTCGRLVTRIIQEELGTGADELRPSTDRPPVRPVTFGELAGSGKADCDA